MSNFETVKYITTNLETILIGVGLKFETTTRESALDIPAGKLPLGRIFFQGESFESTLGEKPTYIDVNFLLSVVIRETDPKKITLEAQRWVHRIRDILSVDTLNIGELATSKLISRVTDDEVTIDHEGTTAVISYPITIRYREQ